MGLGQADLAQALGQPVNVNDECQKPLRVLLIGNSYCFYNHLPRMLELLSRRVPDARPLEVHSVLEAGATWEQHWEGGIALTQIWRGGWDYVILQEQSMRPLDAPDRMRWYGSKLAEQAREQGAWPIYFMTWAHQGKDGMQAQIAVRYRELARDTLSGLAPVGEAWQALSPDNGNSGLKLYDPDGTHPSVDGSYVAACMLWTTIHKRHPKALPSHLKAERIAVHLTPEEAQAVHAAVWDAWRASAAKQDVPPVPGPPAETAGVISAVPNPGG